MAGPGYNPYGQQGNSGLKKVDDNKHYAEEDELRELKGRAYHLKEHEKRNLREIEDRLRSRNPLSKPELQEYQQYLDKLSYEIKEILQEEKSEGISNMQLEKYLRKAAQLMGEVSSVLDRN